MNKVSQITLFKGFGTIQESKDEDGRKCYIYNHLFFNEPSEESTLKGAREMLEYYERQAQDIKQAIAILSRHNYKILKEVA